MNKHDQKRKDDLVKTLAKAKEQAETCKLYLSASYSSGNANIEELSDAHLVLEDIDNVLERLGALVPEGV